MDEAKRASLAEIKKLMREGKVKIEPAPAEKVEGLESWVRVVLDAIGVGRAFVTDQSRVDDFRGLDGGSGDSSEEEVFRARLERASAELGVEVSEGDYVWELAERAMNRV